MPNVGPYIYDVSISGFTRSSIYIYIYDISSLRVNGLRTGGTRNKFRVDKEKGSNESVEERDTERVVRCRSTGGDQNKT